MTPQVKVRDTGGHAVKAAMYQHGAEYKASAIAGFGDRLKYNRLSAPGIAALRNPVPVP